MPVLIVASAEPRAGRTLIAAATAYRLARDGRPVTLARLAGDDSAEADAATFAALEYINASATPLTADEATALTGDVVLEAPPGSVRAIAAALSARVLAVGRPGSPAIDASADSLAGRVVTHAPQGSITEATSAKDAVAVLPEDYVLAAPSVADIVAALDAEWLAGAERGYAIDRVMIGTVASDAASPYFGERRRTCVITRFDKTDIQLAALLTDLQCLVLTGGGEPSPFLLDRVANEDVAVVRTNSSTVDAMRAVEGLYARSRFDGESKLMRAVELLDAAGVANPSF